MEITFKKKRTQPLNDRLTIPVTNEGKNRIENLKRSHSIDINEMVRNFLDEVCQKVERGEYQRDSA